MSTNIDSLNIAISANANQAVASLDRLAKSLGALSSQLNGLKTINSKSFSGLASAFGSFKNIKTPDITGFVNSLSKLGGKNVERAIQNLPRLSNQLNELLTTLSRSPKVSKDVIQLITAISKLNVASAKTVNSGSKLTGLFNGMGKMLPRLKLNIGSLASVFGTLYANFFFLKRGAERLWKAIKLSMDYIEDYNYFNVTWDKVASEWQQDFERFGYENADAYAESFTDRLNQTNEKLTGLRLNENGIVESTEAKSLGLDISLITQYQASLGAVTNSLGLTGEASVQTAMALSNLAGDMSSLKNIDLETVMTNFQSGLIGQSRALYKYGIDITNATLQQYAYKYGIEKSLVTMTQAEKMQLRLLAILDQSKVAYGDLANTIEAPSNQFRVLKANVQNLARTIGGLFIPIISRVLPYINGFVNALQRLITMFAGLVGIKIDFEQFSEGYLPDDSYGDELEDVEDGYDKATKSAEKYKKTILGIDEIHKLNSESTGGSGAGAFGGGGAIDLTKEIMDAVGEYQKVFDQAFDNMEDKIQRISDLIVESFETKNFFGLGKTISDSITEALNGIDWERVYGGAKQVGSGFAQFLNGLFQPETFYAVGKTIANSLNTAIKAVFSFGKTFDWENLGNSIASGINGFFENFDFTQLAEGLNTFVKGIETAIATAIKNIKWGELLKNVANFVLTLDVETVALLSLGVMLKSGLLGKGAKLTAGAIGNAIKNQIVKSVGASSWGNVGATIGKSILGLGAGVLVPVGILLSFSVVSTAFAWKYQNDKEFQKEIDDKISKSPLKHVETNLDYGSYFDMEEALAKQVERKNKRGEFVLKVKAGVEDSRGQLIEIRDNYLQQWNQLKGKVLGFTSSISTKAQTLRDNMKNAWNGLTGKALNFVSSISTTAKSLRDTMKNAWSNLGSRALSFTASISTTAKSLFKSFKNAWDYAKERLTFGLKIPKFEITFNKNGVGNKFWKAFGFEGTPNIKVKYYAGGGFPNVGELFVANEAGPEMVGRMGSRSAVANTDQITEGISNAVYPAVFNAMMRAFSMSSSGNGGNVEFVLNIEGREVARAVNNYNKLNNQMYDVEPRFV